MTASNGSAGTVNVRHTVCSNPADDCYDMAQGTRKGHSSCSRTRARRPAYGDPHGLELDNTTELDALADHPTAVRT